MKGVVNEKKLLQDVVMGDQGAYKTLFSYYWDHVYHIAFMFTKSKELAEDMTQDVFAHIWRKREKLAKVERFEAWLFIISRNLFYDKLREKTFSGDCDEHLIAHFADQAILPDTRLETKELESLIHQGIHNLPPRQQTAFSLSRFQGLTHEEIAVQMGVSTESVKSYMVRSIVTLRKFLKQHAASLHSLFF